MTEFGTAARSAMQAADVSLRALAKAVPCDPGHLSKILAGHKRPSPELAARIDDTLDADGTLAVLVQAPTDGEDRLLHTARNPRRVDASTVCDLAHSLASYRRLDDSIGSEAVLTPALAQLKLIETLVTEARGAVRQPLVDVASQWCQFAGWLHISIGAPDKARGWFDQALVWAAETGNADMTSEALSMKGSQAWRAGNAGATLGLSQAAQRNPCAFAGQHAISATQEARGHAMIGDAGATERKLDDADRMATVGAERREDSPPWLYYHSPGFFDLHRGLAYRHLGHWSSAYNDRAVEALRAGLDQLEANERDSEWAAEFKYHLALTHTQANDPERAVIAAADIADVVAATGSARLRRAVKDLEARLASRWPGRTDVAELAERLRAA